MPILPRVIFLFIRNAVALPVVLWTLIAACSHARAPGTTPEQVAGATIEPRPIRLRVLATTDFHGNLHPTTPTFARMRAVGGAPTLASYFARDRAAVDAPTLLVDAGDVMQGTPVSNLTHGRAAVDYFNAVGYTAAALGNHEFDWGIDTLRARMAEARFAWLGANVYVAGADTLPDWVDASALVSLVHCAEGGACDSVRVGIVGIATKTTPVVVRPSLVAELGFGDEAEAINRWVPRLRAAGAEFVIVTAHSGAVCKAEDGTGGCEGEIIDVAQRLTHRPDLIVAGHTHAQVNVVVNGVRIVQASPNGTRYSIVDLERVSRDSVSVRVVAQPIPFVDAVLEDSAVTSLVARWDAEVGARVHAVVATLPQPLSRAGAESALGNLIADAQRAAGGTQVAIMNNGGIRTDLPAGPVTYTDIFRLQPFANTLLTMRLTGAQLRSVLEHALGLTGRPTVHISGLRVEYDPAAASGARIRSLHLANGAAVLADNRYSITVNNFLGEGGDGFIMLLDAESVEQTGITNLNALIDYLRSNDSLGDLETERFRTVR